MRGVVLGLILACVGCDRVEMRVPVEAERAQSKLVAPESDEARLEHIRLLEQRGQWGDARIEADLLVLSAPSDASYLTLRGDILVQLGDTTGAADDYRAAMKIDPTVTVAPMRLASLTERQQQVEAPKPGMRLAKTRTASKAKAAPASAPTVVLPRDLTPSHDDELVQTARESVPTSHGFGLLAGGNGSGNGFAAIIHFTPGRVAATTVKLNRRLTVPMYVDMGASDVAISRSTARRLGMDVDSLPTARFQTAGGIRTSHIGHLAEVRVQGIIAQNVECSIGEDSDMGPEGLLGQSFLGRFRTTLDAQHGEIEIAAR